MSRKELVDRAKAILAEAYEEAAEMVMLYVERTGEPLQVLCKEIDPDNWNALRNRVQRAQAARKVAGEAGFERAGRLATEKRAQRATRNTLREADDEQVKEIVASLPPEAVERVAKAVEERAPQRDWTTKPKAKQAGKLVSQRLHDAVWQLWLIQDELQDTVPEDEERVRMLGTVRNGRAFLDALQKRLELGEIDDDLAAFLAEVQA